MKAEIYKILLAVADKELTPEEAQIQVLHLLGNSESEEEERMDVMEELNNLYLPQPPSSPVKAIYAKARRGEPTRINSIIGDIIKDLKPDGKSGKS